LFIEVKHYEKVSITIITVEKFESLYWI